MKDKADPADDASEASAAPDNEPVELPKSPSKLPMIMMGVGVIALAGGAWLAFGARGSENAHAKTANSAPGAKAPEGAAADAVAVGPLVALDAFTVNLSDEELHYLKCSLTLETSNPVAAKKVQDQMVRIRNATILFLSNLKVADTRGSANKERIQTALTERIVQVTGPGVKKAYITEFVVQ